MPVLKHFDGICHVYCPTSRPTSTWPSGLLIQQQVFKGPPVCNAAETLLVHRDAAAEFLAGGPRGACVRKASSCAAANASRALVPDARPATDDDFRTEYLDLILSVKVVDTVSEAIDHIEAYGSASHRRDCHERSGGCERVHRGVDSAAVLVNAKHPVQ